MPDRVQQVESVILTIKDGSQTANIPHIKHHSTMGISWGYPGSGPADLALSILEWALWKKCYRGIRMRINKGQCFKLAWDLHQLYKREVIVPLVENEGHEIPLDNVLTWIGEHKDLIG